jgi:GNAT superfamily N-acetyltransferase
VIPFHVRLGRPSDLPFVVDSWVKRGHARGERLRDATARVRAILADDTTELRVACLPDDEDAILGWAAVTTDESPRLHYAYVRKECRRQGIANALLPDIDASTRGQPWHGPKASPASPPPPPRHLPPTDLKTPVTP